ncbi:MAG TPA: hypothetical protein VLG71_02980, partial [Candidatus Limnocylindria bacterium]|nr:hypothetical protein [Candidatus Limnocylindria bacterium]
MSTNINLLLNKVQFGTQKNAQENAQKNTQKDMVHIERATRTIAGTVVHPASLGIACTPEEWRTATKGHRARLYLQCAFYITRQEDRLSMTNASIWKVLMLRAECSDYLLEISHKTLQENFFVSEATIRASLITLVNEGYIEILEKRYTTQGKEYVLSFGFPKRLLSKLRDFLGKASEPVARASAIEQANLQSSAVAQVSDQELKTTVKAQEEFVAEEAEVKKEAYAKEAHPQVDVPPARMQDDKPIYIDWMGNWLKDNEAFETMPAPRPQSSVGGPGNAAHTALPPAPYRPQSDWIGDVPGLEDLQTLKSWLDHFKSLCKKGHVTDAKAYLKPHQRKLIDWGAWAVKNAYKVPDEYLSYVNEVKNEYLTNFRRFLVVGEWELEEDHKRYQEKLAKLGLNNAASGDGKPKLSDRVAFTLPYRWVQQIDRMLSALPEQLHQPIKQKRILEVAYFMSYNMPFRLMPLDASKAKLPQSENDRDPKREE